MESSYENGDEAMRLPIEMSLANVSKITAKTKRNTSQTYSWIEFSFFNTENEKVLEVVGFGKDGAIPAFEQVHE